MFNVLSNPKYYYANYGIKIVLLSNKSGPNLTDINLDYLNSIN